ncbi:hypothetical protein J8273_3383 [Carpediemonas membranifera]|uniref:IBR domain-containing protein n=1 Tax=Carpediemonas membranifera TaxID=201153 RepID=A0A8J6E9F1_9EUKA|nr:hypothetical protein J8273_3383 [Carpediemonas membranifera]|eukprot:KAG9393250.1 hypothetical protein J8273_3383 [Carpediemonas membranifera]
MSEDPSGRTHPRPAAGPARAPQPAHGRRRARPFPADSQGVQDALRTVLEVDDTRRRFAFHVFGGQLPPPDSIRVTLHDFHRVLADCEGGLHIPDLPDPDAMAGAVSDSTRTREIKSLIEQNRTLMECKLVTLGGGAVKNVPVLRRCPWCGEIATREGDLDNCKISTCVCGNDFCHNCLVRIGSHAEHVAHYGGECEMAPRQRIPLPAGFDLQQIITCPFCHRSVIIRETDVTGMCRVCGNEFIVTGRVYI